MNKFEIYNLEYFFRTYDELNRLQKNNIRFASVENALEFFDFLVDCVDVENITIASPVTGELFLDWNYIDKLTYCNIEVEVRKND